MAQFSYANRSVGRARYAPAVQSVSHSIVLRGGSKMPTRLPRGLTAWSDLDFLGAANPFVSIDHALYSLGQINGLVPQGITRPRPGATVILDSGGLQYGRGGKAFLGDQSRDLWARQVKDGADRAMTLDFPTSCIGHPTAPPRSFADCLNETLLNLDHAVQADTGAAKILNVLQGRTANEAKVWFDAVKDYDFDGFAIAGGWRLDFYEVAMRVIAMVEQGLLSPERPYLHLLGTARSTAAVLLTALQRGLNEKLGTDAISITFDSSTPFILASKFKAFASATPEPKSFAMRSIDLPTDGRYIRSAAPFLSCSGIGRQLTEGDICVRAHAIKSSWDDVSHALVALHNLDCILAAHDFAHHALDLEPREACLVAPPWLVRAVQCLRTMFKTPDPRAHVLKHRADLQMLCGGPQSAEDDDV